MFLTYNFWFDAIEDQVWRKIYFEAEKYRDLVSFFMSPCYLAMVLVEHFFYEKKDIFSFFDLERSKDYIHEAHREFKKKYADSSYVIDFRRLSDFPYFEIADSLHILVAMIYIDNDMNEERSFRYIKELVSSRYLKTFPIKDVEQAAMYQAWNSKPYTRVFRLTYSL